MHVEVTLFFEVQRSRADAAEDAELVARFIDGSITINTF